MANVLIHEIGKETKIEVKQSVDIKSCDFFSMQYESALRITESIVSEQTDKSNKDVRISQVENSNNIITFVGDRGSGKTSCMLTFANILDDLSNTEVSKSYPDLKNYVFYILPTFDPSFFVSDYNIIGSFIAHIYDEFQAKAKNAHCYNTADDGVIQDFYKALADAQQSYRNLCSGDKVGMDDMEKLEQLSSSIKLKSDIKRLVDVFLCFMRNMSASDNEKKMYNKLVLCIDDIDLNTETAVPMMEYIRKYLIQPNIIILFALKLDQMIELKRLALYREFHILISSQKMSVRNVDEMVEKYIAKILPLNHRVYMPEGDVLGYSSYKYILNGKESEERELRQYVVEFIFRKTRYLFYNQATSTSLVVPRNLREVLHLMSMLITMPDIKGRTNPDGTNDETKERTLRANQKLFKEYIFNDCVLNYLTSDSRQLIDELLEVTEAKYFNSKVLYVLNRKFKISDKFKNSDAKDDGNEDANEIPLTQITKTVRNILNEDNIAYNISTGDALWILNWLNEMHRTNEELYFLFIVRFIYSIRMYECYDQIFGIDFDKISEDEKNSKLAYSHPKYELKNVSQYQQLIAGQLFNSSLVNFIPEGKQKWFTDGFIDWIKVRNNVRLNEKPAQPTNPVGKAYGC